MKKGKEIIWNMWGEPRCPYCDMELNMLAVAQMVEEGGEFMHGEPCNGKIIVKKDKISKE